MTTDQIITELREFYNADPNGMYVLLQFIDGKLRRWVSTSCFLSDIKAWHIKSKAVGLFVIAKVQDNDLITVRAA